jgi:hypothetical protein
MKERARFSGSRVHGFTGSRVPSEAGLKKPLRNLRTTNL